MSLILLSKGKFFIEQTMLNQSSQVTVSRFSALGVGRVTAQLATVDVKSSLYEYSSKLPSSVFMNISGNTTEAKQGVAGYLETVTAGPMDGWSSRESLGNVPLFNSISGLQGGVPPGHDWSTNGTWHNQLQDDFNYPVNITKLFFCHVRY